MAACEVHHVVEGPADAPVLVLANSLGSTTTIWDALVPRLAPHLRVVRYDLRGHGRSPVPPGPYTLADLGEDVIALLDRLGVERASICGISLGGMTGMWLGAHAPERVERLILCCTSARLGPPERWRERAATVRTQGTEAVAGAVLPNWFSARFAAAEAEFMARMRAMLASTPADGYAACCGVIEHMDLRDALPGIAAPTLVIGGREDGAAPPEHQLGIVQGIPGARLVVLPDAAHLAPVEQPAVASGLILEHLGVAADPALDAGLAVRRAVLGDAHVDRAIARTTPFTADFQDFITRYAWGGIWTRPGLDRRTRSCITLAALTALGREGEIPLHVRGAVRNGLSREEIAEVLLHTAVYAGVPATNAAFQIAQRVLAELETEADESANGEPRS
jgi:3-oxoadipate enol-lactonase/4-carboxymuconolactone decarboxylase